MDLESDEMFRVLKGRLSNYKLELKASLMIGAPKAGAATANKKSKKVNEEVKSTFVPDMTPPGQKKDMTLPMAGEYQPKAVEAAWYSWWETSKFFHADEAKLNANPDAKKYTMVIPPPNVTGALHLGHALMLAIEDAIMRWKRMSGYEVCWLPGVDHAGIATQSVVEKKLWQEEKKTRHDFTREEFIKKVWDWKNEYGDRINLQFRRYGISVDWERFVFTLDDERSKAVVEAFVQMYDKKLIYRATRLVNWCTALKTALSDLEVEYIDLIEPTKMKVPGHDPNKLYEFGALTEFAYKVKGTDREIIVATTRLETMLGDVAVAVHPDDPRYKDLIGKEIEHPFIKDRKMVIIADSVLVDMNFGTGAVKITPAHDHNDYACGNRHGLEKINILDEDGRINHNGGPYKGMLRFDCREQIQKDMEKIGIFKGKKPNPMRIGLCSKTNDIIEPFLKPQWYVDCKDMADRSVKAVRTKELEIIPDSFEHTWFQWLENIQDWCISRQLWWGHRIPAYLVTIAGVIDNPDNSSGDHYVVGRNEQEAKENAAKKFGVSIDKIQLSQDEDVLDTWFSSGLFPFSSFGWPDQDRPDLKAFFPGHLLETGSDIIFFWVARMVMMSLCLTDKLPFTQVFLHPMVRDAEGRKMSKSKGNVVDPLEVIDGCPLSVLIEKLTSSNLPAGEIKKAEANKRKEFPTGIEECGSDALRFGLLSYMVQSSINLNIKRVIGYRQFCNKLWNVVRFALTNFNDGFQPEKTLDGLKLSLTDKWLLTKLNKLTINVNQNFQDYKFGDLTLNLYEFWLKELCDVYVEAIKPVMKGNDEEAKKAARNTLYLALDYGLKMLHPTMPFITEELYQRLPHRKDSGIVSICIAEFPTSSPDFSAEGVEDNFNLVNSAAKAVRSQLGALNVASNAYPTIYVRAYSEATFNLLKQESLMIQTLARAGSCTVLGKDDPEPEGVLKNHMSDDVETYVKVVGLIDINLEIERLMKRQKELDNMTEKQKQKMSIKDYETKVPENVRKENDEKLLGYERENSRIGDSLSELKQVMNSAAPK